MEVRGLGELQIGEGGRIYRFHLSLLTPPPTVTEGCEEVTLGPDGVFLEGMYYPDAESDTERPMTLADSQIPLAVIAAVARAALRLGVNVSASLDDTGVDVGCPFRDDILPWQDLAIDVPALAAALTPPDE